MKYKFEPRKRQKNTEEFLTAKTQGAQRIFIKFLRGLRALRGKVFFDCFEYFLVKNLRVLCVSAARNKGISLWLKFG